MRKLFISFMLSVFLVSCNSIEQTITYDTESVHETETADAKTATIFESSIEYDENNSVLITYTDDLKMSVTFFFDGTDKQTEFNRVYAVTLLVSEMQDILNDGQGDISLMIATESEEGYDMGYITYRNGEVGELSSFPESYEGLQPQEDKVTEEWQFANQQVSENMKRYTE